jgi:ribosomal protein L29
MKKNDLVKLRGKKLSEIEDLLKNKKLEFIKTKTNLKANREKNLKKAKTLSHEVSQILTIIREKELSDYDSTKTNNTKEESTETKD